MTCGDCHSSYRNELDREPKLRCRLCLQGCHDCSESERKVAALLDLQEKGLCPSGGVWLCYACLNKNNHSNLGKIGAPKNKQKLPLEKKDLSLIQEEDGQVEHESDEDDEEEEEEQDNTKRGSKISPRRDRTSSSGQEGEKHDHMKNICPLYIKRQCPHGLKGNKIENGRKCAKNHPPRCRKYCGFGENRKLGCTKGRECKFFHPKLCRNSVLSHKCMNQDCTFVHLKRTIRPKQEQAIDARGRHPVQPRLARDMRSNSAWSVNSVTTPYQPTVGNYKPQSRMRRDSNPPRKDNSSEQTNFLGQLEEMKKGLYQKMDERFDTLMTQLQDKLGLMDASKTMTSRPPSVPPQMLPSQVHPQHLSTMHIQPPMTMLNPAQYQSSFF